jgi:hypothetical protein
MICRLAASDNLTLLSPPRRMKMGFTDYAKSMGYDKGATLGVASSAPLGPQIKPATPLGQQLAGAFSHAQDLALNVERLVDALLGPQDDPTGGSARSNPTGLCGELSQQAEDTRDAIEKAERRLIQLRNRLIGG